MKHAGSMFEAATCEELQWKLEEACREPERSLKETKNKLEGSFKQAQDNSVARLKGTSKRAKANSN